jgi:exopolysaccharide production protein ExoQ
MRTVSDTRRLSPVFRRGISDVKQRNVLQVGQSGVAFRAANLANSRPTSNLVYAASIYYLLHTMSSLGVIDMLVYGPAWTGKTGNKITMTVNLLGILVSIFLFWSGMRRTTAARINKVLPLLAASLLLVSALWSIEPRLTFTQGTAYFFVVVGAIGLAQTIDRDELMDLVSWTCALSAVASLLWQFVLFPAPAFNGIEPDFAGIFSQKNVLGLVMAAGVLGALHSVRIREKGRLRYICMIALCTVVAHLSRSSTSVVAIGTLLCLDLLGRLYFKGGAARATSIFLFIGFFLAVVFFSLNEDLILEFLGKDPTMTGRTIMWSFVIDNIYEKPLLGWGYPAVFWSGGNPAAAQIAQVMNWTSPNAHNGLLELLLDIGIVGTSLFLFLWARNFVLALKCMSGPAQQFGLTSVHLLLVILLIGISEQVVLSAQQIWTSLFFVMGFICEKEVSLARGARRIGIAKSARKAGVTSIARSPLGNSGAYDLGASR